MTKKLYEESDIQAIADAIREKNGTTNTYTVAEMGGGISSLPLSGRYELIETITLEEDSQSIERTEEPDGTMYNFNTIAIQITFPTNKSGSKVTNFLVNAYIDKNKPSLQVEAFRTYTLNQYTNILTCLVNNFWGMFFIQLSDVTSNRGYTGYQTYVPSMYEIGHTIWKLKISTTLDKNLYAGTIINIYGVRA